MGELINFIGQILEWTLDAVVWAALTLYEMLLIGLAAVVNAIPVPSWLAGADPFASLDPGVAFFAQAFEIPAGVGIILSAYGIRFLVRRLPVIG